MPIPNDRENELGAKWYVRPDLLAEYREEIMKPLEALADHYEHAGSNAELANRPTGLLYVVAEVMRMRFPKKGV